MTDPVVSLNGVTATLADGSTVQFLSKSTATSRGSFTAALAQYDVVNAGKDGVEHSGYALTNALDMSVKSDIQRGARRGNQGDGSGHAAPARACRRHNGRPCRPESVIHLPAGTVVPLAEARW